MRLILSFPSILPALLFCLLWLAPPASGAENLVWRPATGPDAAAPADQVEALRARSTPGSRDWLTALAAASDLQREVGDSSGARALAATVIGYADVETKAPGALTRALVTMAGVARDGGDAVGGEDWAERALATAERNGLPAWLLAEIQLNLAVSAQMQQKLDESEAHLAAAATVLQGREDQEPYLMAQLLGGQAVNLVMRGRPLDGLPLMEQSIGWFEQVRPAVNTPHVVALQNLMVLASRLDRPEPAAWALERIEALCRADRRPTYCDEGRLGMARGLLARVQDRLPEAERHYAGVMRAWGAGAAANPEWLDLLANLGGIRVETGRARVAVDILRRGVEMAAATLPPSHPRLLGLRGHYATALSDSGDTAGAVAQYRLMINALLAASGENGTASARANLGTLLLELRDPAATEELQKAYALLTAGAGPRARMTLAARANLVRALIRDGDMAEASRLAAGLSADAVAGLGARHSQMPYIASAEVAALKAGGRPAEALALAERTLPLAAEAIASGRVEAAATRRELAGLALDALWVSADKRSEAAQERAFALMQAAFGSTGDLFWAQAAVRMARPETAEAARAREAARQRLRLAERAQQKALAAKQPVAADITRLTTEADRAAADFRQADAALRAVDPRLGFLSELPPVTLVAVRRHLGPAEGMLLLLPGAENTHVMLIGRDGVWWHRAELPENLLCTRVAGLRLALDPARPLVCGTGSQEAGDTQMASAAERLRGSPAARAALFNRDAAHALYRDLLASLEPALGKVKLLHVVTSGALAQLPLATLVTAPPTGDDANGWRQTRWLIRGHALSHLPSPAAFVLSRGRPQAPMAGGLLAFGDPCFTGVAADGRCRASAQQDAGLSTLPPLPGSRMEVETLGARFANARILLGTLAAETAWNDGTLGSAGTVALATHGLVTGEAGAAEPALALTPGEESDGYLSASEIARGPDLSGRMLVLSGCNTASPGSDSRDNAATALVRALFAAGARAVLASQIPVRDDIAPRLTVPVLTGDGGAESLRQAMLAVLEDPALPPDDPRLWSGFALYQLE